MSKGIHSRGGGTVLRRGAEAGESSEVAEAKGGPTPPAQELPGFDEAVDPDELREFMSGDWLDVKADPTFREKLRDQLWNMIRDRSGKVSGEDEEG